MEEKPKFRELEDYYSLIKRMLEDIDRSGHLLEQTRHFRIRNTVVNMHSTEVSLFQQVHEAEDMRRFHEPCFQFRDINRLSSFKPPNQAAPPQSQDHAIIQSEMNQKSTSPESAREKKAKASDSEFSGFTQDKLHLQGTDHLTARFKSLGFFFRKEKLPVRPISASNGTPGYSPPSYHSSSITELPLNMDQHFGPPKYTIGRTNNPSPAPHPPPESDIVGYRPDRNTVDRLVLQWTNLTYDELQEANGGIKGTHLIIS